MSEQDKKCMDHSDCNWKGCAFVVELEATIAQLKAQLGALHGQIMNLPLGFQAAWLDTTSYRVGHRDARHQAAELVAATAQPGPSDGVFNEVRRP